MPLSINVGLSRKASKDYQSQGVSINVTAELDQSLLAKPDQLQQQIEGLYQQAEAALDRRAGSLSPGQSQHREQQHRDGQYRNDGYRNDGYRNDRQPRSPDYPRIANTGASNSPDGPNGGNYSRNNGNGNRKANGGGMTDSQRKAIYAISRAVGIDPEYEVDQNFGWKLGELTVKQASEVIDHLKGLQQQGQEQTAGSRNGSER